MDQAQNGELIALIPTSFHSVIHSFTVMDDNYQRKLVRFGPAHLNQCYQVGQTATQSLQMLRISVSRLFGENHSYTRSWGHKRRSNGQDR